MILMLPAEQPRSHLAQNAGWRLVRTGALIGVGWAGLVLCGADPTGGISETPLAPAIGPRGPTMFAPLRPEDTGVSTENRYADPKMWGEFYQEFLFGALGTGVAIGDFDNDGRPDIFAVSKTESCRLFRNLGGFKFEDVTDKAGVADVGPAAMIWKQGVSFADVNNDGWLDIYVCRFNAPNLLYINQRNGTFKEMARAHGLAISDSSGMAAFCDYDRDGWLDVYVATNLLDNIKHPKGQRGHLLRNKGDGNFADVTDQAGIGGESQSHSATWWDQDSDGWPELYVANDYGVPDKLYHNNRDGTFRDVINEVLPHTAFSAMGSDLGDVNNDGLMDFIVGDMAATTHQKDQRGPADSRGRDEEPMDGAAVTPKYHRNALLLNTGMGRMQEAAFLAGIAVTGWTWSLRFEDLDNDGRLDFHVCNGMIKEENVDVNTRMMKAESTAERVRIMRDSPAINESNLAFRNCGDLEFKDVSVAWGLDQKGISFGSAFGDLDGDGDLDLVYANYQGSIALLRNDCATGHRVIFDLRGTVSNRYGVGATVRLESAAGVQVRQLAGARGYMSSSEPAAHFGLGPDAAIKRLVVSWPSGHRQTFENLPADRRFVITEPGAPARWSDATQPVVERQFEALIQPALFSKNERFDEVAQQRLLPIRLNRRGPGLAIGDLNGDGIDDLFLAGTTLSTAQLLVQDVPGHFSAPVPVRALGNEPVDQGPPLIFDASGDGLNDLLITKGGNSLPAGAPEYQARLYFNDGHGSMQPAPAGTLPGLSISAGAAVAADFDRDGQLDVFIGGRVEPGQYPETPRSVLLANRAGRFVDATESIAPGLSKVGMVTSALWSDADNDGWLDLLLTLDWGQVKYFHNNRGQALEDWTEQGGFAAAGTGWWTSLATADFNGDGRPDYAVGNLGLNTQYQASAQRPAMLFRGDFIGNGQTQLIEAYYEEGRLYPWRCRRDLGAAVPSILKRYPRNDFYARAALGELLGDDKLAAAQRLAATEFRSGVFLSQPDGRHRFASLPRLAQIAPLQGMVAGDFDGDGRADLYAVQNSHAPIAAVGRFAGGLSQLMRGDGHGNFTPVPPSESGLVVPGDAKALVVLDLDADGWPDFFVTRNNSTTQAFRNRGVIGHNSLRVNLRGPAGNPTAVGARITLELKDASVQTGEIQAGSGYSSQSIAACFFGFPDGNPPVKINVRWPWGPVTGHSVQAHVSSITLAAPGL